MEEDRKPPYPKPSFELPDLGGLEHSPFEEPLNETPRDQDKASRQSPEKILDNFPPVYKVIVAEGASDIAASAELPAPSRATSSRVRRLQRGGTIGKDEDADHDASAPVLTSNPRTTEVTASTTTTTTTTTSAPRLQTSTVTSSQDEDDPPAPSSTPRSKRMSMSLSDLKLKLPFKAKKKKGEDASDPSPSPRDASAHLLDVSMASAAQRERSASNVDVLTKKNQLADQATSSNMAQARADFELAFPELFDKSVWKMPLELLQVNLELALLKCQPVPKRGEDFVKHTALSRDVLNRIYYDFVCAHMFLAHFPLQVERDPQRILKIVRRIRPTLAQVVSRTKKAFDLDDTAQYKQVLQREHKLAELAVVNATLEVYPRESWAHFCSQLDVQARIYFDDALTLMSADLGRGILRASASPTDSREPAMAQRYIANALKVYSLAPIEELVLAWRRDIGHLQLPSQTSDQRFDLNDCGMALKLIDSLIRSTQRIVADGFSEALYRVLHVLFKAIDQVALDKKKSNAGSDMDLATYCHRMKRMTIASIFLNQYGSIVQMFAARDFPDGTGTKLWTMMTAIINMAVSKGTSSQRHLPTELDATQSICTQLLSIHFDRLVERIEALVPVQTDKQTA